MSNKIKQEMNKIEIPKQLSERSHAGVYKAKQEMKKDRKRYNVKGIAVAAAFLLAIGTFALFNNDFSPNHPANNQNEIVVTEDGGVKIPAIQLPEENTTADMIGLIVYNGKIYTQTSTEIDEEAAKAIVGEHLGTTKGSIDEWSKQEAYDEEFASTVGIATVYSVKGYDQDFRIMTYEEHDGKVYAQFYENLNGITITNGNDLFGKLNIKGNITSVQYRTYSDWDNSVENYQSVINKEALNNFVEELHKVKPFPRRQNSDPIGTSRSDEQFRELRINLNDGSTVRLILLQDGYIYYGYIAAYFKMNEDAFSKLWSQLE